MAKPDKKPYVPGTWADMEPPEETVVDWPNDHRSKGDKFANPFVPNVSAIDDLLYKTTNDGGLLDYLYHWESKQRLERIDAISKASRAYKFEKEEDQKIERRDRIAFALSTALNIHTIEVKILIIHEFIYFLNNNNRFDAYLTDGLISRAVDYILHNNTKYTWHAGVVMERVWKALLEYNKEYDTETVIVYLFLSLFGLHTQETSYKISSNKTVAQFHGLLLLNWHSKFIRTESNINGIIRQTLVDIENKDVMKMDIDDYNIEIIFTYALTAVYILFIELEHLAHSQNFVDYQSITQDLSKACSSAILKAFD